MKKLLVTYHMRNAEEDAETCITLPMADHIAASVLKLGEDSVYMASEIVPGGPCGSVRRALEEISEMQGYVFDCFCCAEELKGGV